MSMSENNCKVFIYREKRKSQIMKKSIDIVSLFGVKMSVKLLLLYVYVCGFVVFIINFIPFCMISYRNKMDLTYLTQQKLFYSILFFTELHELHSFNV